MFHGKKVKISFFCYLMGEDWSVFEEIAERLKDSDAYKYADKVFITATIKDERVPELLRLIEKHIPKAELYEHNTDNDFEYKGLKCLYETAEPDALSLYIHTKGIANPSVAQVLVRRVMYATVLHCAELCLESLSSGKYDMVGAYKSKKGFCWFNFYWITGEALKNRKPKQEFYNRYYYEASCVMDYKRILALAIEDTVSSGQAGDDLSRFEYAIPYPEPITLKRFPHPILYIVKKNVQKIKKILKSILVKGKD